MKRRLRRDLLPLAARREMPPATPIVLVRSPRMWYKGRDGEQEEYAA